MNEDDNIVGIVFIVFYGFLIGWLVWQTFIDPPSFSDWWSVEEGILPSYP